MSGSFSDSFEVDVLKALTGQTTTLLTTTPITPYLALHTGSPGTDTAGTEATGGGYARVSTASKWGTPSAGTVSNNATISFTTFTGSVSSGAAFTHFGIWTASSGGTCLVWGDLTDQTKTGGNGDTISLNSSALTINLD